MPSVSLYSGKKTPRRLFPINNWVEGISDFNKEGGSFVWARGVDYRSDPSFITLLPQALLEASSSIFTDLGKWAEQVVGRTVILGNTTNLIANPSFETNSTGWTLGADYTRVSDDAYLGTFSIKQVSTTGSAVFSTASGSGLAVTAYADYQLVFYVKVVVNSGQAPQLQVLGGSLAGPNLLSSALPLSDTAGAWVPITVTFNAGQYASVFLTITNQGGNVTAHYDNFSLLQINSLAVFSLGNNGGLYKRYSNGTYVTLGTLPNSHGNGMAYYGEDDYLYVMGDKTVGRYGPISSGTPTLVTDYLQSAGGVPTNTNSALLVAANSDYFVKTTPSAALEGITGNIAIEAFIKPTSLPAVGSSMTIAGVWNENTNKRAWKLDLFGISGVFGTAADGNLTISANTVQAPIDSQASGTSGTNQLNANNVSFAAGQKILIIQMQGSGVGTKQLTSIQSYDSTNHIITTQDNLNFSYNSSGANKAQVIVVPQYGNITINNGFSWTAKAWNGITGGVLVFLCNGTLLTNSTGVVSAAGCGYRGGSGNKNGSPAEWGVTGEGEIEGPAALGSNSNHGAGGGSGNYDGGNRNGGGGGGSNVAVGGTGGSVGGGAAGFSPANGGTGGQSILGAADLSTITMGGGGGSATYNSITTLNPGGAGGGIIFGYAATITNNGTITADGANGISGQTADHGSSGAGAGGDIFLATQAAVIGSGLIHALGGIGGTFNDSLTGIGGNGGNGRIHISFLNSLSGTTNPTADTLQDTTLVTSAMTQVRIGISNDGTSFEYLAQNLQNLTIGGWDRIQVSWQASISKASFYENGSPIGTSTGSKTAIYGAGTADFAIGANVGASVYQNFLDAEVNDVRVWSATRTQQQFADNNLVNLGGIAAGLNGNWFLTNTGNDLTTNANNVVATGSPTPGYVTDVPYAGATTRGDVDQTGGGTGFTYTLPTTLTENQNKTFVPAQDPQKSLQVNINAKGTGDVTLVVHDGLNRVVAQLTVLSANLPTSGQYEFVYPAVFSPVVGATYHFHLYSTVNDCTIKTTAASDITTAQFTTYFQFLLNDTEYHPAMQMGNVLGIGNGRYLAVLSASGGDGIGIYNGQGYNSRRLRFPAGWRVRALSTWRGYYAIGCWRGTNIKDFDQGIVFLWDGNSVTYNDFFFVPEGAVNALYGENGTLYIVAGYHGDLLEYTGGDAAVKVKRIPKVGKANYVEVEPGSITYYDALLRIGVAYNSDSTTLERGIYTWGTRNIRQPKSLSFDYPISTGNRGTTVKIGALVPVGGSLLVHFQDNVSFGANTINPANPVQTTGTIENLITDFGAVWKEKQLLTVRADHLPLPAGANIDVKYKLNYEASWHNLGITSQVQGADTTRLPIAADSATRYHAIQLAVDFYAAAGNSPTLLENSNDTDMLVTETDENDN